MRMILIRRQHKVTSKHKRLVDKVSLSGTGGSWDIALLWSAGRRKNNVLLTLGISIALTIRSLDLHWSAIIGRILFLLTFCKIFYRVPYSVTRSAKAGSHEVNRCTKRILSSTLPTMTQCCGDIWTLQSLFHSWTEVPYFSHAQTNLEIPLKDHFQCKTGRCVL